MKTSYQWIEGSSRGTFFHMAYFSSGFTVSKACHHPQAQPLDSEMDIALAYDEIKYKNASDMDI